MIKNLILVLIARVLFLLLEPISFVYVVVIKEKISINRINGYLYSSAYNTDRFGNHEFRSLFNRILIIEGGHQFGDFGESVSSVLGRNKLTNTLSKTGIMLDQILDFFDKDHSIKAIPKEQI